MNVISLFDGMSCGYLALERAGIEVGKYFASEIDVKAIQVSKNNFPTIHLGSVENWKEWNDQVFTECDLLIGGSPCQGFSFAGKQLNFEDPRSKLFFVYVDILKKIRETNPGVKFLLENVPMKTESENVITEILGVNPIKINSGIFGAQSRERLYWTNIPVAELPKENKTVLGDLLETNVDEKYFYKESFDFIGDDKVVCAKLNINGHDFLKRVNSRFHKCQTLTAVCGGNQQKKVIDNGRVRKLTPLEYERVQGLPDGHTSCVSDSARYKMIGNGWEVNTIAHIFSGLKSF